MAASNKSPLSRSVGITAETAGERDPLVLEVSNGLHRASGPLEGFEHEPERALHLPVGIEVNHPVCPIDETHESMQFCGVHCDSDATT